MARDRWIQAIFIEHVLMSEIFYIISLTATIEFLVWHAISTRHGETTRAAATHGAGEVWRDV